MQHAEREHERTVACMMQTEPDETAWLPNRATEIRQASAGAGHSRPARLSAGVEAVAETARASF